MLLGTSEFANGSKMFYSIGPTFDLLQFTASV